MLIGKEIVGSEKSRRYFLLLISPITWFRCFSLIFGRTRARTPRIAFAQYFILSCVIILMVGSCYLFYAVTSDSGQYSLYLSDVAANKTSMYEGRKRFDNLIWRSVLKTFFLGTIFGLIQACNFYLAAQWRQRLCDRFHELLFESSNGCVLYETSQKNEDMPRILTSDIKQFTTNFCTVLFGSIFFAGLISVLIAITLASVFLVLAANGDATGILICYSAFVICLLLILPSTQLYNWNLLEQSKLKGILRGYVQRIKTNAECIVLYGSQRVELQYIKRLIAKIFSSMLISSISFALVNFPIQLLTALNGMCTYVMPAIVFFFVRKTQTTELAQAYLTAIPLYSFLITVLGQLLLIIEPALITVTMGDHLWTVLNRLENIEKEYKKRMEYERNYAIRHDDTNRFTLEHFNISIPDAIDGSLLQSDINLDAIRRQCVLISGPSGCGKTSLFRICAGLRPIDAKQIILPERRHLLFVPQKPYLPLGDLRFQALFLLEHRYNVKDADIYQLFKAVNLQYLCERYTFDTVVDWSTVLSVGEQQRLAFLRLFAYFTLSSNYNQLIHETLVLFDESTSAVDAKTEHEIYANLIRLQVWFVTISHRTSLIDLHTKTLHLYLNKTSEQQEQIPNIQLPEITDDFNANELYEAKQSQAASKSNTNTTESLNWRYVMKIFQFIHLPFPKDDQYLKLQTIIAWIVTLLLLGISTWCTYRFTKQTASLYNVLSDYSSSLISLDSAKQRITSDIVGYAILTIATPTLFSLTVGGGQTIASLYSRRQMIYLVDFLLDGNDNNLLYHSRHLTQIPSFISHDISELNSQLFYFIFGHIYYTGVIGQIILAIILSILLGEQDGGPLGVLVVFLFVIGFFIFTNILSIVFNKWVRLDEMKFSEFVTGHKRTDLQAEQIALSGKSACRIEHEELHERLNSSIRYQMHSGFLYSIIVGIVRLSVVNTYLINYGIPAAIFFYSWYKEGLADPTKASRFVTLSVYMYQLYSSWNYINYFADPLIRIQSIGIRIVNYLEHLRKTKEHQYHLAINEQKREYKRRKSDEASITLNHVNVYVPESSQLLISDINLTLSPTDSLIITGPSGCGKSTLLRLLAGLIRPNENQATNFNVRICPRQNTIFLCQQLHLIQGTLREQLSYLRQAHGLGSITDDLRVRQLLNEFRLGHLIEQYSMDGQPQSWFRLLSIGEQQRLMMVTALVVGTDVIDLLILDEITSGCDEHTERIIYEYLQRSNIQFLSVSHRKEIEEYHTCKMTIDANRHSYVISRHK
ncbi:unnamed protein product [Adineta ricciae]|uniref:ABC transporter domain-containing protein n=1 Tax=Adineta ricciae TaxID=249248 RepID=A0A814F3S6_ADIRI|nr:unnamed protein product [Adineta ricciae]CAF1125414.1 unnamed protein product [Adineta ricciae]